ncbi:Methyltransferase [Vibrio crassostreae]|nr:Methyltransferase [Vibrio crassostreae]CAK2094927.1 Methyltransferase [Vibrio crassostreae]CAK2098751.1 Methyltransferase [Vibrio crassostreae]CAK2101788.1 Methyltransferase [Vibrio crassostreae]CAK2102421.1 Methyltransferase [Vibrio crassostreae]
MMNFTDKIQLITPEHDSPYGLIHPYWARKPLNIIESLVCNYSNEGDVVADPFMGSGTTVIAALKNDRKAVGSDLSPVSNLLVNVIFSSSKSPSHYKSLLGVAFDDWCKFAISLYLLDDGACVERENYLVDGKYKDGDFSLVFQNAKVKAVVKNKLKGGIRLLDTVTYQNKINECYLSSPIDFDNISFTENTRIAVHKGVKASDFFTKRNIMFINYVQSFINNVKSEYEKKFFQLFLSSMIPMLRLSDKKASSQWPYWRPKNELTSRNPIVALNKRYKAFVELLNWEEQALSNHDNNARIYQLAAVDFPKIVNSGVDLIITDPPYADHAPYMEYSELYWTLISGQSTKELWHQEIVKTNAVGREEDSLSYDKRLYDSFFSIISSLKDNGYFIFFYLDKNINHWSVIKKAIIDSGCVTEEVIAIPKQRRSMKAVTSPGKTLDGDLIVVCKKVNCDIRKQKVVDFDDIIKEIDGDSYFKKFALFIERYLNDEIINIPKNKLKDISKVL